MITKELGERIRELRAKTGLSQEKFALKIGMGLEVSLSELFKGL